MTLYGGPLDGMEVSGVLVDASRSVGGGIILAFNWQTGQEVSYTLRGERFVYDGPAAAADCDPGDCCQS